MTAQTTAQPNCQRRACMWLHDCAPARSRMQQISIMASLQVFKNASLWVG